MRGTRRFSQAISEGDGISLLAHVSSAHHVRAAEAAGAEGLAAHGDVAGARDSTEIPILWCGRATLDDARRGGADAFLLVVDALGGDDGELERLHGEAVELGLDPVLEVRDDDQLRLALDRVDGEIFFLSASGDGNGDALEHVLGLLPDVPAGKLAVAEVPGATREQIAELERAGVDAAIVPSERITELIGDAPPGA